MTDETIHKFVERRDRELWAQIDTIKGQIKSLEAQLASKQQEHSNIKKAWDALVP